MKYIIQLSDIKKDIEQIFNEPDLGAKARTRDISMYRNLYFVLSKKFTNESLIKIGREVNRDHSTVLNGLKKYDELIMYFADVDETYKMLQEKYTTLENINKENILTF